MDYAATLAALNIALGDTGNVTFTPEEKERALTKAWNDSYVVQPVWNTTLTFASGTYQYALPTGVTTVKGIYIRPAGTSDTPTQIDPSFYSVVGSNIQFNPNSSVIPAGYGMYVKGNYKLDPDTDTLSSVNLQEYVIALAGVNTLYLLGYKKANLFLKNDLTMSELVTLRREFQRDVAEYRARLQKEYEDA